MDKSHLCSRCSPLAVSTLLTWRTRTCSQNRFSDNDVDDGDNCGDFDDYIGGNHDYYDLLCSDGFHNFISFKLQILICFPRCLTSSSGRPPTAGPTVTNCARVSRSVLCHLRSNRMWWRLNMIGWGGCVWLTNCVRVSRVNFSTGIISW